MDKQILENQIQGLEAKLKKLQANEKLFIKAQGIDETIAKSQKEIAEHETETHDLKEQIAEKKAAKAAALKPTGEALAEKMKMVLSRGAVVFDISEGSVFLGWKLGDKVTPYAGLSGGQKMEFDPAFSKAMLGDGPKLIVTEAAEINYDNIMKNAERIRSSAMDDEQFIINFCHVELFSHIGDPCVYCAENHDGGLCPSRLPDGWNVVKL